MYSPFFRGDMSIQPFNGLARKSSPESCQFLPYEIWGGKPQSLDDWKAPIFLTSYVWEPSN
jgi:hypothetical protein